MMYWCKMVIIISGLGWIGMGMFGFDFDNLLEL